ncbi:MAG: translation elongation factor Ts [Chloroflexi bacterium]|nr:translation elongation factor Ts [Chloroflexota bacterium]
MNISAEMVKELREQTGAGVMDCRNALVSAGGDINKAVQTLKEKGLLKAQKKSERATGQGLVEAYIHTGGRIGAMLELNCETDFVARTAEFKELAHSLAMQIAAQAPRCVSREELPESAEPEVDCLLLQPFIRDPSRTIQDIITETIAKVGENIRVRRFVRYELGD